MKEKSIAYLRARVAVIHDLLEAIPENRDWGPHSQMRTLLKNGVITQVAVDFVDGRTVEKMIKAKMGAAKLQDAPLTFTELTSFNTWFAQHPEKVAGEEIIATSREFPVTIKGSKEDIVATLKKGIKLKEGEFTMEKEILAEAEAEAILILLNKK